MTSSALRLRHPAELGEAEVGAYLSHLAIERKVSASTQQQALSALVLFYRKAMHRPLGELGPMYRAQAPARLPVVLTRAEVHRVLEELDGIYQVVAMLLYGSGLRLLEAVCLRVKDLDFARGELAVRRGKGAKDRVTVLPERLRGTARRPARGGQSVTREGSGGWGRAGGAAGCAGAQVPECGLGVGLTVGVSGGEAVP